MHPFDCLNKKGSNPVLNKTPLPISPNQPDNHVLSVLASLQRLVIFVAALISGVTLLAWLIAPLGRHMPDGWQLMKANTALCGLLCVASLLLSQPLRPRRDLKLSRALATLVAFIGSLCVIENLYGISFHIDRLLASDPLGAHPGRMSAQTSWGFVLLGVVLCCLRTRKGWVSNLADVLTMVNSMLMLIYISGYFFGAAQLLGPESTHRVSPQTLLVLLCLTFTTFNRRAEYGSFGILLGVGIAGATARLAAPFALLMPFVLMSLLLGVSRLHLLSPVYAMAVATSVVALLAFCLVIVLSRRVAGLEHEVRELSLRDPLTGVYNRRGFFLLAEQALRVSRRSGEPFSLLFIDIDNLKIINDTLGHETGSEILQRMSALLLQNFRETDITGRLGGDEFVVAGKATAAEIAVATYRLQKMVDAANVKAEGERPLSFSFGHVTADHRAPQTLESIIGRADKLMYEAKRNKRDISGAHALPTLVQSSPVLRQFPAR
ncbi:GGDEF domain-containing protein [Granulicella rosea]|uniref:GGDEF domain-containing protein n=1 Tax=Granulicella rosea TaxID=474952 RepID=UPI001C3DD5FC|nr:GGDEF domain-containing protein [Granulicella rosea]